VIHWLGDLVGLESEEKKTSESTMLPRSERAIEKVVSWKRTACSFPAPAHLAVTSGSDGDERPARIISPAVASEPSWRPSHARLSSRPNDSTSGDRRSRA